MNILLALNEVVLGILLIVKGFDKTDLKSRLKEFVGSNRFLNGISIKIPFLF